MSGSQMCMGLNVRLYSYLFKPVIKCLLCRIYESTIGVKIFVPYNVPLFFPVLRNVKRLSTSLIDKKFIS